MDIYPKQGKMMTSVLIPIAVRRQIKERNMTIVGAIIEGLKAIDERKTWNSEKEARLKSLEEFKADIIKKRNVARMMRELEKNGQSND